MVPAAAVGRNAVDMGGIGMPGVACMVVMAAMRGIVRCRIVRRAGSTRQDRSRGQGRSGRRNACGRPGCRLPRSHACRQGLVRRQVVLQRGRFGNAGEGGGNGDMADALQPRQEGHRIGEIAVE